MYFRNEADRIAVEALARIEERSIPKIAAAIGVSVSMLRKYYPDELSLLKPPHPNDYDSVIVRRAIELGFTPRRIAELMGLSIAALKRYYCDEIAGGCEQ